MPKERAKSLPHNLTILNPPFLSSIVLKRIPNAGAVSVDQKHGEAPVCEKADRNGHLRKSGAPSRGQSGMIHSGVEGKVAGKALRAHRCLMGR